MSDDFNGADLRNICTEAGIEKLFQKFFCVIFYKYFYLFKGMMAIRADRDYVIDEDFKKATRKIKESK